MSDADDTRPTGVRIGDAAAEVGVPAHVLRHWESVGLLEPPRSASGHRAYDAETIDRARLVRTFRRAGLSLGRIGELGLAAPASRPAIIAAERAALRQRIELLEATDRFLAHVTECRHPVIAECPECSGFVGADPPPSSAGATVVRC